MNEELDSQLSAMFDNELPAAECELLARRLSRDEELKARWSRYAAIGATIRAEGGLRLNSNLAVRVNNAISAEPAVVAAKAIEPSREQPRKATPRWLMPLGGVALAASVAAAAILFLRYESPMSQVAQSLPASRNVESDARREDAPSRQLRTATRCRRPCLVAPSFRRPNLPTMSSLTVSFPRR